MKNKITILFFALFVIAFLIVNLSIPYVIDDRLYAHIFLKETLLDSLWGLDVNHPIQSFGDVLLSQYHHYLNRNGRAFVHTLVQCFCGLWGKLAYDICSALVFIGFSFLLTRICLGASYSLKNFRLYVVPLLCLFFLSIPEPTCFYAGIAYGINYLWASTASLLFIYLFFKMNSKRPPLYGSIMICVLSYLCGWTHEGFAIAIAGGIFFYLIFESKKVSNLQKWMGFCYMLGTACLVFAPSNFSRASGLCGTVNPIALRMNTFIYMRATYLMLFSWIVLFFKRRKELIAFCNSNYIFIVMWAIAFLFILVIGPLNDRSVVGIDFFAFILWAKSVSFTFSENRFLKISYYSNFVFVLLLGGIAYYQVAAGCQYRRIDEILEKSTSKDCVVAVPPVHIPPVFSRYVVQYPFNIVWKDWEYLVYSWFYGKNEILIFENSQRELKQDDFESFFNEETKVKGKNDFYKIGDWMYAQEPLDNESPLLYHLGAYQAYDVKSSLKKLISYFYKPKTNLLVLPSNFEPFEFQNHTYYRMYMYPYNSREILSIDTTF